MRRMEFFRRGIMFYSIGIQSFSVPVANAHPLVLIGNEILHILSLKLSFHTDGYCKICI